MRAGALRHRITIERQATAQDDWGGVVNHWATIGTFSASIEPINGREYFAAQAVQSEVTARIRMRYHPDVLPSDRVNHNGTIYNVLSIIDKDMKNIQLELMCKSAG